MRSCLRHSAAVARRADTPALAREGHDKRLAPVGIDPDVIRPPSRTIEVPVPRAPSPLKNTSLPVTVRVPLKVFAPLPRKELPMPLNVSPTPALPEITPRSERYMPIPPALFVIVRVALPREMPTLAAANALLPVPSSVKSPPIVILVGV